MLEDTVDHAAQAITEGRDAVQGLRISTVEKNDLAVAIQTLWGRTRFCCEHSALAQFQCGGGRSISQSASDPAR